MKEYLSLSDIQKIENDILCHIDSFCKKRKINYFLACGTLLGAVRHHGFIPWDDDVDIYMLRKDYDLFLKEYDKYYDERYRVLSIDNDPLYYYDSARVVDMRTAISVDNIIENPSEGLWVDIFPLDNIPRFYYLKRKIIQLLFALRVLSVYTQFPASKHSRLLYPIWYASKSIGPRFFLKLINRIIKSKKESNMVGYMCSFMGPRTWVPKACCESSNTVVFEGNEYPAFNNYEGYLKSTYGDYMTLPPLEKRVSHPIKAYWR